MSNKLFFDELDCFIDVSANVKQSVPTLKKFIKAIADMGYTGLIVGLCDNFEVEGEPYYGLQKGKYTKSELKELDGYGKSVGVELKPHFQNLGHVYHIGKYAAYKDIMDDMEVMLADDGRTYALVEKMMKSVSECFSSDCIHIGMDEAFMMGRGKHMDIHGYESCFDLLSRHMKRVMEIARKYGYKRFEMWSDMFLHNLFKPEVLERPKEEVRKLVKGKIPDDVTLSHWTYIRDDEKLFRSDLEKHFKLSDNISFTGAAFSWCGYAPDNAHSIRVMGKNMRICKEMNVRKFNMAVWAGSGTETSLFYTLPSLYCMSEFAYGNADCIDNIEKDKFKKLFGINFDDFMLLDLANKPHPGFDYNTPNCKHYFYAFSDPLLGVTDSLLSENTNADYRKTYEKLSAVDGGGYKYLFSLMAGFCKVLSNKAELGKNIKDNYDNGDKVGLIRIAEKDIPEIIKDFRSLYESVNDLFKKEFKPFGQEVVNIRFGGMIKRLERVSDILKKYAKGEIKEIAELKAERLNPNIFMYEPNENNYLLYGWNMLSSSGWI